MNISEKPLAISESSAAIDWKQTLEKVLNSHEYQKFSRLLIPIDAWTKEHALSVNSINRKGENNFAYVPSHLLSVIYAARDAAFPLYEHSLKGTQAASPYRAYADGFRHSLLYQAAVGTISLWNIAEDPSNPEPNGTWLEPYPQLDSKIGVVAADLRHGMNPDPGSPKTLAEWKAEYQELLNARALL